MLRTRNRSIKDFVSKDKEKDDGISRVLGSGTKDLKNESSSQRTCSYTLWNISINSYIKNSFIFNFVWSLTFSRRALLPRSRQQLFFVLQLTLPLRMPYVPIATPPTDVRKISFRVTSIAPSPAWTLTWRAGRGMTTHVSDTWAGTGRGDQSFPRRHAYFFLLPSSGTGNREKTGDKQVKHSSNKSFRGQQLKKMSMRCGLLRCVGVHVHDVQEHGKRGLLSLLAPLGTGRGDQWFPWRQPRIHDPPRLIILSSRVVTAAEILIRIVLVVNEFNLFFWVMEPIKQPKQFFHANFISTESYMDPTPCIDMPVFHPQVW